MTMLELLGKVKVGIWQFWRLVGSMNHDYPYHDYTYFINETQDDVQIPYIVGSNNLDAHGDQRKLFTAKRTLLWSVRPIHFKLNNPHNAEIQIKLHALYFNGTDVGEVYQMELHVNVSNITFTLATDEMIHAYFEGVLPDETRHPE